VIAVLASSFDSHARRAVEQWGADRAALLTPADLSAPGWRHDPAGGMRGTCVIDGRRLPVAGIMCVIVCLSTVVQDEVLAVRPSDRAFVAAEMSAFLLSWLSTLKCPVINRPTSTSLSGPGWRPEQWTHYAAKCGLRIRPALRRVPDDTTSVLACPSEVTVTLVAEKSSEPIDETLMRGALRLAAIADVELLTLRFSGSGSDALFLGAHAVPDLSSEAVRELVFDHVTSRNP
jgi:hypothetical protein